MTTRTERPLKPRQVLNLWTNQAAAHPFSIEARRAEAANANPPTSGELFNCWRCRLTDRKPQVDDDVKGRKNRARAQAAIDEKWAEDIARHQAGDCLRIPKVRLVPGPTRRRMRATGNWPRCGAVHPDYPGVTCTAHAVDRQHKPRKHLGKHRAKLAKGAVVRWAR